MYTYGQDTVRGLLVSLHTGRYADLNGDFALFREVFLGFVRDGSAVSKPLVHVVVVENAYPTTVARAGVACAGTARVDVTCAGITRVGVACGIARGGITRVGITRCGCHPVWASPGVGIASQQK